MLYIVTDKSFVADKVVFYDVEEVFKFQASDIVKLKMFEKIIYDIDEATLFSKKDSKNVIRTPFGVTSIDGLSSGCKAVLLAATYPNCWVNMLEAGGNAWDEVLKLAGMVNMHVLSEVRPITLSKNTVNLNGKIMSMLDVVGGNFYGK